MPIANRRIENKLSTKNGPEANAKGLVQISSKVKWIKLALIPELRNLKVYKSSARSIAKLQC